MGVPVIKYVVVFSFLHIFLSCLVGATIKMQMVLGFLFQMCLPKKASSMGHISLHQKNNFPGKLKKVMLKYPIICFA